MAAEVIAGGGHDVTVFERMPSLGRKFLLAGRGGLNLTHSEEPAQFMTRYAPVATHLDAAVAAFPPEALRGWCEALGQPTFVGSSGRVFPTSMKTSPLLRAWLRRLAAQGVTVRLRHAWRGWDEHGRMLLDTPEGACVMHADATVLALGGASWPQLGSDGAWVPVLTERGIAVSALKPANCGFRIAWSEKFKAKFAGQPLKRLALQCGDTSVRGEAVVTAQGLEGGGIYALARELRAGVEARGSARLVIDLRPDMSQPELQGRLAPPRGKQSLATHLRKALRLAPAEIGLLQEAVHAEGGRLAGLAPDALAALIKALPVTVTGTAAITRAISTAGGVAFDALDERYMLRARPGVFVAGEMLDWEAPTGGYLLQGCFATGAAAGRGVLQWLRERA